MEPDVDLQRAAGAVARLAVALEIVDFDESASTEHAVAGNV